MIIIVTVTITVGRDFFFFFSDFFPSDKRTNAGRGNSHTAMDGVAVKTTVHERVFIIIRPQVRDY